MELEEFIKSTLVSIAKGVRAANEATKEFRKEQIKNSPLFIVPIGGNGEKGKVSFDIALTVKEETSGKGGGGIRVVGVGVGAEIGKSIAAGHENRIRFDVDVSEYIS